MRSEPAAKRARARRRHPIREFLGQLGVLRIALASAALLVIVFAARPGTPAVYAGWELVPSVLLPILAPLVWMVLVLDALMSRVFMTDQPAAERRRFKRILTTDVLLALGIVLFWMPYFLALGK